MVQKPFAATAGLTQARRAIHRIAHISDVHMLEAGPVPSVLRRMAIRFVSAGRAVDARARTKRLKKGLSAAIRSGADHLVISGDLTEVGSDGQFEAFSEALDESGISPENITLVPGNHDAYTSGEAWKRALDGPLRAYRGTSAEHAGKVVDRGDIIVLPLDVTCYQAITRSAGELTASAADAMERRFKDPGLSNKAVVVVQHHPPFAHETSAYQWLDGLRGHGRLMSLLTQHQHVQVLHGHLHKAVDRLIGLGKSRVFGAPATVEDDDTPRVRLYEVRDGQLESVGLCTD
jgi:Icc protein